MSFWDEEKINQNQQLVIEGKKAYKYADVFVCDSNGYYHTVFVKISNFYTILMSDLKTNPTPTILLRTLKMLKDIDFARFFRS